MPTNSVVLKAVGLEVGPQFPAQAFDDTNDRVWAKLGTSPTTTLFLTAWNGVALRYYAVTRHASAVDASLTAFTGAPPAPQRAEEEDALFGLYGAALSAIECVTFAAFVAGSIVQPSAFPIATEKDLRAITPSETAKRFASAFLGDQIVTALQAMLASPAFGAISGARNVLSHRGVPPRTHNVTVNESLGGPPPPSTPPTTIWALDGSLLAPGIGQAREAELAAILAGGITAVDVFTATHF